MMTQGLKYYMVTLGFEKSKNTSKKGAKRSKEEENIQLAVCNYIRNTYPDVIFMCDMSSGMKMPIWLAARNKKMRSSKGLPDLFIAYSTDVPVKYNSISMLDNARTKGTLNIRKYGLFLELKKEDVVLKLKNGDFPADKHLREQKEILIKLREQGYMAEFACGYKEAVEIIDNYLK